jgi:hypothetical protein
MPTEYLECYFCDAAPVGELHLKSFDVEVAHGLDSYGDYPLQVCERCSVSPKPPTHIGKTFRALLENIVRYTPYEKT